MKEEDGGEVQENRKRKKAPSAEEDERGNSRGSSRSLGEEEGFSQPRPQYPAQIPSVFMDPSSGYQVPIPSTSNSSSEQSLPPNYNRMQHPNPGNAPWQTTRPLDSAYPTPASRYQMPPNSNGDRYNSSKLDEETNEAGEDKEQLADRVGEYTSTFQSGSQRLSVIRLSQRNWNDNSNYKPILTRRLSQLVVNPAKVLSRLLSHMQHSTQLTDHQLPVLVHLLSLMQPTQPTLLRHLLTVPTDRTTTIMDLPLLLLSSRAPVKTLSRTQLHLPPLQSQPVNILRFNSLLLQIPPRLTARTLLFHYPYRTCSHR